MWIYYAIVASLCWGMSYAASGPLLKKGFSPFVFFFGYSLCGLLGAAICLLWAGKLSSVWKITALERSDLGWFLLSIVIGALGACLTYMAMADKNPTLAALIEISYPLFVVLFTWFFFRQCQLNPTTFCGGLVVLAGVAVIIIGER